MPVVGFLNSSSQSTIGESLASFRHGLKEYGYVEGQNLHLGSMEMAMPISAIPADPIG
jgi:hypothetical protein